LVKPSHERAILRFFHILMRSNNCCDGESNERLTTDWLTGFGGTGLDTKLHFLEPLDQAEEIKELKGH
jgi:hypothetical protein